MKLRTAGMSFEHDVIFSFVTDETEPGCYDEFIASAQEWLNMRQIKLGEGVTSIGLTQMIGARGDVMEYRIEAPRSLGPYPVTDEVIFAVKM